ncbi:hypothetical protein QVD17_39618 [Tagetes erecta]|uniref:KEN domain-containing protein n=1 Tax=Tagetes erecta TaxID=13708 RepID=A0AAD8NFF7_TARER|nr:hypothetical protein QVD17_39618 [Tagetes erecta]
MDFDRLVCRGEDNLGKFYEAVFQSRNFIAKKFTDEAVGKQELKMLMKMEAYERIHRLIGFGMYKKEFHILLGHYKWNIHLLINNPEMETRLYEDSGYPKPELVKLLTQVASTIIKLHRRGAMHLNISNRSVVITTEFGNEQLSASLIGMAISRNFNDGTVYIEDEDEDTTPIEVTSSKRKNLEFRPAELILEGSAKVELKSMPEGVEMYFRNCFPKLLVKVYNFMYGKAGSEEWMKKYLEV